MVANLSFKFTTVFADRSMADIGTLLQFYLNGYSDPNQCRKTFSVKPVTGKEDTNMKTKLIAVASAATIALATVAIPNKAEAYWRGGWWVPGAV